MIEYIDRETKQKKQEKVFGKKAIDFLYGEGFWSAPFSKILLPLIAHVPFFSHLFGWLQKTKRSKKKIAPFIEEYGVDKTEFLRQDFASFNDFFTRKLKSELRPIDPDPDVVVMPADGRYLVFEKFQKFQIKGKVFFLQDFLQSVSLARHYVNGAMAIVRLCPSDYHRFHFPVGGSVSKPKLINGALYSVNPLALRKRISIFAENKRMLSKIYTERFGTVLCVEIGASAVGTIHQTFSSEAEVKKGDEKGYFSFGGSCIVLLFEKGKIVFDSDLLENSALGLETLGKYGSSLGRVLSAL